jgi:hypothetical protein
MRVRYVIAALAVIALPGHPSVMASAGDSSPILC